jgi:hypothetical protein
MRLRIRQLHIRTMRSRRSMSIRRKPRRRWSLATTMMMSKSCRLCTDPKRRPRLIKACLQRSLYLIDHHHGNNSRKAKWIYLKKINFNSLTARRAMKPKKSCLKLFSNQDLWKDKSFKRANLKTSNLRWQRINLSGWLTIKIARS